MCMVTFDPRRYIWLISLINVDILFWCPMEWLYQHGMHNMWGRTQLCVECRKLNKYFSVVPILLLVLNWTPTLTSECMIPDFYSVLNIKLYQENLLINTSQRMACLGMTERGTRGLEMCRSYSWQLPQEIVATAPAALGLHFPQLWGWSWATCPCRSSVICQLVVKSKICLESRPDS